MLHLKTLELQRGLEQHPSNFPEMIHKKCYGVFNEGVFFPRFRRLRENQWQELLPGLFIWNKSNRHYFVLLFHTSYHCVRSCSRTGNLNAPTEHAALQHVRPFIKELQFHTWGSLASQRYGLASVLLISSPRAVVSHRDEMIADEKPGWDLTVINGDVPSLPLPQELCSPFSVEAQRRRAWDPEWAVVESGGVAGQSCPAHYLHKLWILKIPPFT